MPTIEECKKALFNIGIQCGVSPNLISERLLSKEDKQDMLNGLVPIDSLLTHVKVWAATGMCNYANGSCERYTPKYDKPISRYRGYGKKD